jgi:NADPH:quinone reductase-like Zn-dependent oxidoreductase
LSASRRVLNPKGIYIGAGGTTDNWMIRPLLSAISSLVLSLFGSQKFLMILAKPSKQDLTFMRERMESGKITPVIDRRYRLSEISEAIRYLELGHARGKVIVTLENN